MNKIKVNLHLIKIDSNNELISFELTDDIGLFYSNLQNLFMINFLYVMNVLYENSPLYVLQYIKYGENINQIISKLISTNINMFIDMDKIKYEIKPQKNNGIIDIAYIEYTKKILLLETTKITDVNFTLNQIFTDNKLFKNEYMKTRRKLLYNRMINKIKSFLNLSFLNIFIKNN